MDVRLTVHCHTRLHGGNSMVPRRSTMTAYATRRRPPRTMTEREQARLLKVTGEHARGFRDHMLFAMAMGTGLRESEVLALDLEDITGERGQIKRSIVL